MCSRVLLWLNPKTALPPSCLPANNVALVHPYTPISTSPTQKGREKLKERERDKGRNWARTLLKLGFCPLSKYWYSRDGEKENRVLSLVEKKKESI